MVTELCLYLNVGVSSGLLLSKISTSSHFPYVGVFLLLAEVIHAGLLPSLICMQAG